MEDLLQVGVITQTHGIKGEVKIYPMTDDVKRFKKGNKLLLDTGKENLEVEIQGVKYFKQYVILKFKEFDSINDIEKYCKKNLYVTRENAVKCEKDEYFIADLIDMKIIDEKNETIGLLTDVLSTGANDVYVVTCDNGEEVLLPAIKECILNIDMNSRIITIHKMDGLFD